MRQPDSAWHHGNPAMYIGNQRENVCLCSVMYKYDCGVQWTWWWAEMNVVLRWCSVIYEYASEGMRKWLSQLGLSRALRPKLGFHTKVPTQRSGRSDTALSGRETAEFKNIYLPWSRHLVCHHLFGLASEYTLKRTFATHTCVSSFLSWVENIQLPRLILKTYFRTFASLPLKRKVDNLCSYMNIVDKNRTDLMSVETRTQTRHTDSVVCSEPWQSYPFFLSLLCSETPT